MSPVRELCEVLERRRVGAYQAVTLATALGLDVQS